jgi:xanthine dehydrogenase accessory factor
LGAVIETGDSLPLSGEPQPIGGAAREHYVYAPVTGLFTTAAIVRAREEVARIHARVIRAPLTGQLRGITHTDVPVRAGTKIVEVNPRIDAAQVRGIGRRPAAIAEGVLRALTSRT